MKADRYLLTFAAALVVLMSGLTCPAQAQCLQKNYISDGAPSSLRDCQPMAALATLAPEQMSPEARALADSRYADIVEAARFYGFDLNVSDWGYRQSVSPLLQHHIVLAFTHAGFSRQAGHFVAVVSVNRNDRIQIVATVAHNRRLFDPASETRGTYSVFNRLLASEQGTHAITQNAQWITYGALYLALAGGTPAIPTETDSIVANWNLAAKHGTTPVILVKKDGGATLLFSDLSEPDHTLQWKLTFSSQGQIVKAEHTSIRPGKVQSIETLKEPTAVPPAQASALNP